MPAITKLTCPECKIEFERPSSYVRAKASYGQTQFYCKKPCWLASKKRIGIAIALRKVAEARLRLNRHLARL